MKIFYFTGTGNSLAIARKMLTISFAEPATLLKRTSEKAPMTATPVPTLPLTSMMTV